MHKVITFDSIWDVIRGPNLKRTFMSNNIRRQISKAIGSADASLFPEAHGTMLFAVLPDGQVSSRASYSIIDFMKDFGGLLFLIQIITGSMCQHLSDFTVQFSMIAELASAKTKVIQVEYEECEGG